MTRVQLRAPALTPPLHTGTPSTPPPTEPTLLPKLQILLADFPYLLSSIHQRLYTWETCCGYQYGPRPPRLSPTFSWSSMPCPDSLSSRVLFPAARHLASQSVSMACPRLTRKDNSFWPACRCPWVLLCCHGGGCAGSGILTGFPFGVESAFSPVVRITTHLRPDSLTSNSCRRETFLLFSPQAPPLNICYSHQDLH